MRIIKNTKVFILISALIVIAGVVVTALCNGFNYGMEFTGGGIISFDTAVEYNPDDITEALNKSGINGMPIQYAYNDAGVQSVAIFKTKAQDVTDEKINSALEIIKVKYPEAKLKYIESVGQTAKLKSFITPAVALVISAAAVFAFALIYFKIRIAFTIIICLIHDIILLIAVTAITRHEIAPNYAIALMASAAFSVYLNFALFARVREYRKQRPNTTSKNIIEKVLPEEIKHLIYPAAALILIALLLALLTPPAIGSLALIIAAGIALSVYSNIVFAGPLYVKLEVSKKGKRNKKRK